MGIEEISELKDLVTALQVLVDSKIEICVDISSVTLIHKTEIVVGNVSYDFKIELTSDEIENLWGNSKRVKVTK